MATCPACRTHYPDGTPTCASDGERLLDDAAFGAVDRELQPGEMVGEYQIEGKLGEGGFGAVYRATHPLIGKSAAVKVLGRQFSSNPQMVSRFIAEARAVNQIRHKNIIDIFSFGALGDGRQYYVMELLDGVTFDRLISQRSRLAVEEALPILRGIARALDAAHAKGIAHRDLKPENVFLMHDEGGFQPKLLDFGIAKLLSDPSGGHKTKTGTPMGTPYYMSPEQCYGRDVDHRTDIYAFGVVVYEALTGKVPFTGETTMEILMQHMNAAPTPPSTLVAGLSPAVDGPVLAMLAKEREARPQSLWAAVEAIAAAAGLPRAPGAAPASLLTQDFAPTSTPSSLKVTPANAAAHSADAGAQTFLASSMGSGAVEAPKPRRTGLVVAAVAIPVLLLGGAAGAWRMKSADPGAGAASSVTATATGAPSASASPSSAIAAASAPSATPKPDKVLVTLTGAPPKAQVFRGKELVGEASAPVELPYGASPVELTVKAPGYKPHTLTVTPDKDAPVAVAMERAPSGGLAPTGTGTTIHKDLEQFH